MGEVKSVKVDNWGVFFLQKLQNFFNKTDYCDLTLQFRDNSQLKVHRLVLSACTDYFNVLEQTCEIVDDALIMPNEFQADVVVPIVNFMYTGTLEFELKMYGKLLRTAKEMNMTVLLKLLEAHRRTMENVNRSQRPPSPMGIRRTRGPMQIPSLQRNVNSPQQTNRNAGTPVQQRSVGGAISKTQRSPTSSLLRSNVAAIGQQTIIGQTIIKQEQPTSPFEQLRKGGYNNNKRPSNTSVLSPVAKKPNLEDVKEFAEQQRMRKQIAAEFGEDQEYEGMMDDDIHADDDDDEVPQHQQQPQPSTSKQQQQQVEHPSQTTTRVEHGGATIIFKQESPDQQPTIIVKDSSSTKLNHAKIIAEVVRQYPHLMKGQKSIKLKIMPPNQSSPASSTNTTPNQRGAVIKKEPGEVVAASGSPSPQRLPLAATQRTITTSPVKSAVNVQTPQTQKLPTQQQPQQQKVVQQQPASATAITPTAAQKRRIDSKTMHALIALGADNTTGPWLCLRCGVNNRPISIPSYRGFRRHLINTHKESIDPALCEYCGWRSKENRELHFHMQVEHTVASTTYRFPECNHCNQIFLKYEQLNTHLETAHANSKQKCIYCNRAFAKEIQLYNHMKTQHREQALEDGIIDDTDEEDFAQQDEDEQQQYQTTTNINKKDTKVKILSDISLPSTGRPLVDIESTNQQKAKHTASTEAKPNVQEFLQSSSNTSDSEIKFVGADGNEVHLTEEQRKEILAQINQQDHGGVVMVLNEQEQAEVEAEEAAVEAQQQAAAAQNEAAEAKSASTEESIGEDELNDEADPDASSLAEDYDDSQIFNELNSQGGDDSNDKKCENSQLDESKESIDNLEWAENLISEHERETNNAAAAASVSAGANDEKPKNPNLSDKLKELTCDWTEDENEDDLEGSSERKTRSSTKKIVGAGESKESVVTAKESSTKESSGNVVEKMDESVEEEQDDIDLALQDMHKETAPTPTLEETKATEENLKKIDIDLRSSASSAGAAITDTIIKTPRTTNVKDEMMEDDNMDEEFINEATPEKEKSNNEKITKNVEEIKAEANDDDDQLETDSIRKTLIDELMAEAENPKNDLNVDDVDDDGHDVLMAVEQKIVEATTTAAEVPTTQRTKQQLKNSDEDEVKQQNIDEHAESSSAAYATVTTGKDEPELESQTNTEDDANVSLTTTEEEDAPEATAQETAVKETTTTSLTTLQTAAAAAKSSSNEPQKPTTSSNESNDNEGNDKVKSIISEWADDEVDDDDEDDDKVKEEL